MFAKHFTNPIEACIGSGSGGTSFVFFTNAQAADNYGVELELRKGLGMLGSLFDAALGVRECHGHGEPDRARARTRPPRRRTSAAAWWGRRRTCSTPG